MTTLVLVDAGVDDSPEGWSSGRTVEMLAGDFRAREVARLDFLHDPHYPGRVVDVEPLPDDRIRITVKHIAPSGRAVAVGVLKCPNDPVHLSRLVDVNLTRDCGADAAGLS